MSSLKLHLVEKNQLFFNKYRYSARFDLQEAGILRKLDIDIIDELVRERNVWRAQHEKLYNYSRYNGGQIRPEQTDNLKRMCRILAQHKEQIKFVVSYDRAYVYTNDIELVKLIDALDFVNKFHAQEAVQICPAGTIALKDPKWTHRTYFKAKTVTDIERTNLVEYLQSRENVRLSPGLTDWIKLGSRATYWKTWVQDYYFIDHNNDGEVLFLNMVSPRITGRTLTIVAK